MRSGKNKRILIPTYVSANVPHYDVKHKTWDNGLRYAGTSVLEDGEITFHNFRAQDAIH